MRRLSRLLAVLVLLGSASVFGAGAASATALPISQCTATSGVILAVDFSHFGGSVLRSCGSTPTSGWALLNQGGWQTQGTIHDGPAFICRIGYSGFSGGTKYPTPATEACNVTPRSSAYWSYWHAETGMNVWSYSQDGAMRTSPKPGSVDAWVFGAGSSPSFSPASVRNQSSVSPPAGGGTSGGGQAGSSGQPSSGGGSSANGGSGTTGSNSDGARSSSAGPAGSGSTGSGTATARPGARSSGASTKPKAKPSRTSTPRTTAGAPTPSSSSSGPTIADAQPVADVKHDAGSYAPELVAGTILVGLGGLTGIRFWRRKQAGQQL